jgi:hypothetical protein
MRYSIKFSVEPYRNKYVKLSHRWHKTAWKKFSKLLLSLGYEEREGGSVFVRNKRIIEDFYCKGLPVEDYLTMDDDQVVYISPGTHLYVGAIRRFSGYQLLQDIPLDVIEVYCIAVQRYLNILNFEVREYD